VETSDIFTTITRYDKPENRFTASLVYLLDYLWNQSRGNEARRHAYYRFLDCLCGKTLSWGEQIDFDIQSYESSDEGKKRTLDFEIISANNIRVLVEVKESAKHQDYKEDKEKLVRRAKHKRLVLLSRYSVSEKEKEGAYHVIWGTLYTWLANLRNAYGNTGTCNYLLEEFLKYLQGKGILAVKAMKGENIRTGLSDVISLLMLVKDEAQLLFGNQRLEVKEARLSTHEAHNYIGFYVGTAHQKKGGYYIGLCDDAPYTIEMQYNKGQDNWDGFTRELDAIFQKKEEAEQRQEMGRLLKDMYKEIEKRKKKELKQVIKR